MKPRLSTLLAALLLAAALALGAGSHAQAQTQPPQPEATTLQIAPVPPQELAQQFQVTATLVDKDGLPIPNRSITFLVGGMFQGQARTDPKGVATLIIRQDLNAGQYVLNAVFQGTRDYAASQSSTELTIVPYTLTIRTVPAIPGVSFQLADQVVQSGSDGAVTFAIQRAGDYQLQVLPGKGPDENTRVDFVRWNDEIFVPYRTVRIPGEQALQAGFQVEHRQAQTWIDLQGNPVPVSRVTSVTIKNTQGTNYTFADGSPRWLPAMAIARFSSGLVASPIQYGIISVMVDGSNVVTAMQQRFFTSPGGTWKVQLLLFSAQVTARDALFGTPVGSGISMEYPDGRVLHYPFGPDHKLAISGLARGIYYVQVMDVQGIVPRTPIALSQNQALNITIVTRLDIFLAVSAGTMLALGLLFIGRPMIRFSARRKQAAVAVSGSRSFLKRIFGA